MTSTPTPSQTATIPQPCVYVLKDALTGEAVYVGKSHNVDGRLAAHKKYAAWWRDDLAVETIASDFRGLAHLEMRTIERLQPRENIIRNGDRGWRHTKDIAPRLRAIRRSARMTQAEVAFAVGVSTSIVCQVELGRGATQRYADPVIAYIESLPQAQAVAS